MTDLPEKFLASMREILGDEYESFLTEFKDQRHYGLRVNTSKISKEEFERISPFHLTKIPWVDNGYYYDREDQPASHPFYAAGLYYLQEPSAMTPASRLSAEPGDRVLDLCAAPGGKATALAADLKGQGQLVANDINTARARALLRNLELFGISNSFVTNEPPYVLVEKFPEYFDKIMVDAPCSGEGMFRKEEAAITDWSRDTVEMCARRQKDILNAGAQLVCPGGRLVYSTCTFAPEENEQAVASFLEDHPDFYPETVEAPWFTPAGPGSFRLWPHKLLGEGHFAAVLRRRGEQEVPPVSQSREALPKQWQDFARENQITLPQGQPILFGQSLYWAPVEMPDLKGLRVLRPGLELGTVKKDRFEPAHGLALWLHESANCLDLTWDSPDLAKYLHGDVIRCDKKGWCLVRVDGCSIGWGKGDKIMLKNHYPKGLRR